MSQKMIKHSFHEKFDFGKRYLFRWIPPYFEAKGNVDVGEKRID
jgi:hypothetical protein